MFITATKDDFYIPRSLNNGLLHYDQHAKENRVRNERANKQSIDFDSRNVYWRIKIDTTDIKKFVHNPSR